MASYDDTATVSGNIVQVNDGADELAVKNWGVTVAPTLSGVSSIVCTQAKKNLIDNSASAWEQGNINTSGNNSVGNEYVRTIDYFEIKGGANYEISGIATPSTASDFRLFFYDASKTFISYKNYGSTPRTVPENACYFRLRNIGTSDMKNLQIEYGSTATSYEPYSAPVDNTVNLGRTIYGGEVDIVNGTGQETHAKMTFTGAVDETWNWSESGGNYRVFTSLTNAKTDTNTFASNLITPAPSASGYPAIGTGWINNNGRIVIGVDSSITSAADWKAYLNNNNMEIAYELADEYKTDFTFTPITPTPETALGVSNFWSEQGNTELTYYKSGYGFTSVTIHKETPDGEPVEETRKFHRIIYEGQVDVIRGTGLINIGESGTQYDPPEEISFTPVAISTDEGENTFYADEGVSVITYRRGVE